MMINHNIMALNAYRNLATNYNHMALAIERLSSGLRINRAADDPAGLAISEKMRAQIRGLEMAEKNVQDGISLIQTAEGALNETHAILQRIRELSIQAANDTYMTEGDRQAIQREVNALLDEIDAITGRTEFNSQKLLDGSFQDKKIHTGANAGQHISFSIRRMGVATLGLEELRVDPDGTEGGLLTQEGANKAISLLDQAINEVSKERSKLGALQNRLEHTMNNLATTRENLIAAESRIRDADIAKEMMNFTKYLMLTQVGQAVLAQANQIPQGMLQLLR